MDPCGKFYYASEDEAQQHLEIMLLNPDTRQKYLLGIYFCESCEGFHIGRNWMNGIVHLCIGEHR